MPLTDFTGRTVDLFVMQGAKEKGLQPITPGLGLDTGGEVTTGVQKAVQFFLIVFLTQKGSRPHDPEFGTRFMETILKSNINDSNMQITFRDAAEDILEQQARYKQDDARDDEVILEADLVSFASPSPDQMSLTVLLTTGAGETREVILPVSLAIK